MFKLLLWIHLYVSPFHFCACFPKCLMFSEICKKKNEARYTKEKQVYICNECKNSGKQPLTSYSILLVIRPSLLSNPLSVSLCINRILLFDHKFIISSWHKWHFHPKIYCISICLYYCSVICTISISINTQEKFPILICHLHEYLIAF